MRVKIGGKGFFKNWPTFSHWLEQNLKKARNDLFILDNHLRPQWQFISDDSVIFRYEEGIDNIISQIANIIDADKPKKIPHKHSSYMEGFNLKLDLVDKIIIEDFYDKDFTLFNYSKSKSLLDMSIQGKSLSNKDQDIITNHLIEGITNKIDNI